jgi:hypothetical protein
MFNMNDKKILGRNESLSIGSIGKSGILSRNNSNNNGLKSNKSREL